MTSQHGKWRHSADGSWIVSCSSLSRFTWDSAESPLAIRADAVGHQGHSVLGRRNGVFSSMSGVGACFRNSRLVLALIALLVHAGPSDVLARPRPKGEASIPEVTSRQDPDQWDRPVVKPLPPGGEGDRSRFPSRSAVTPAADKDQSSGTAEEEQSLSETFVDTYVPTEIPSVASSVETAAGVFPTAEEKLLLGSGADGGRGDYPRSRGSDSAFQSASGIFPYAGSYGGIYPSHPDEFQGVNRVLGFFSPNDALVWEGRAFQNTSVAVDGSLFNLFVRDFEPDRAMFHAGPASLDLYYLGAGALYSDYRGPQSFPDGQDDGLIGYIELGGRGLLQLTDQFYLSLRTDLIYLPGSNEIGFSTWSGLLGGPAISVLLNHQGVVGRWDYRIYDTLSGGFQSMNLFGQLNEDAFDSAGRYSFGIARGSSDDSSAELFGDGSRFLSNVVGARASALVSPVWRTTYSLEHQNFWALDDGGDGGTRDHAGVLLGYEGSGIPLSPFLGYDVFSNDKLESFYHTVETGVNGRIAENLSLLASTGILWTSGFTENQESGLARLALRHDWTERTAQTFGVGQGFFLDPLSDDVDLSRFVNYSLNHRLTSRTQGALFAQKSASDQSVGGRVGDRVQVAARLNYRPLDYTDVFAQVAFERTELPGGASNSDRSVVQIGINQRLLSRLTAGILMQYEEADFFDESLYQLTVRRYF